MTHTFEQKVADADIDRMMMNVFAMAHNQVTLDRKYKGLDYLNYVAPILSVTDLSLAEAREEMGKAGFPSVYISLVANTVRKIAMCAREAGLSPLIA